jgi:hypothetical protein
MKQNNCLLDQIGEIRVEETKVFFLLTKKYFRKVWFIKPNVLGLLCSIPK